MDPGYWRELLRPVFSGRRIVLVNSPVAGQVARVAQLREFGAGEVFVLGEGMGTGPEPDFAFHVLDVRADTIMESIRAGSAVLRALPADAAAALDAFDPDREALAIGSFLTEVAAVAGRPTLAWRRPEWVALEDKTVVDQLWDDIGIRHAPSRVVSVDELPDETGAVWAGDARQGFHGGAELTRWIRTEADIDAARDVMHAHCDRVRVMPFLEGIPCSIHGVVFPDHVAVLRPVEMMTLRRGTEFFYCGAATFWDPPDRDRDEMRATARSVGAALRERVGFRGAFTVDGVMTHDGFLPTELNPRMGAGLSQIAIGAPDLPVELVNQCLVAGLHLDYRAREFESLLLETADASRSGGTWRALPDLLEAQEQQRLAWTGDAWRVTSDTDETDAFVSVGPSNLGGFVRLSLRASRTPAGPSVAPRAAAFYAFCDRELGTHIGSLEAAPDVRA